MKRIRKILLRTGAVFLGLILALFLLGYLFEDKLHLMAIRELGKALNAKIEVNETNVSFLRSWPDVNVRLEGVSINPIGSTSPKNVIALDQASLDINLFSFFSDRMEIKDVVLDGPDVILSRNEEGNWNTMDMFITPKDSNANEEPDEMVFDLSGVDIRDGFLTYEDKSQDLLVRIDSLYLDLSGDFSAQRTDFDTEMAFHLVRLNNGGRTWTRNKHVQMDLLVDAQLDGEQIYRIREGEAQVAGVVLNWGGEIFQRGDQYELNLAYNTSRNDFDAFMSLLPGGLLDTGREYEYDGKFEMHGWIRGLAGASATPSIYADYSVQDGAFHYTDYDSRLTGINLNGSCQYKSEELNDSWFKVDTFRASLRNRPVSGNFGYTNFAAPHLNSHLEGKIALEDIREFYPAFADSSQLAGNVDVDLRVDGKVADFKNNRYRAVKAQGSIAMNGVNIADKRVAHPIKNLNGEVKVDNHHIQVTQLSGKVGRSDFEIQGMITEYLPWFFGEDARIKGTLELKSETLNLNDWIVEEEGEAVDGSEDRFAFHLPEQVDMEVRANIGDLSVAKFRAQKVSGQVRLYNKRLNVERLSMYALQGDMVVTGALHARQSDHCDVIMDVEINNVDVNQTFKTFDQLAAFALVEENMFGTVSGQVHVEGQLDQYLDLDPNSLISYGNVKVKDGRLKDFEPLEGLAGFVKMEDLKDLKFSDVQTNFRIESGFFYLPGMYIEANKYKMNVSGRHGFDNSLDYRVAVELPRKAARESGNSEVRSLVDIESETKARIIIPVRITGTVDHPKYALDGQFVKNSVEDKVKQEGEEMSEGFHEEIAAEFGGTDTVEVEDLIVVEKDPGDTNRIFPVIGKLKNPLKKLKWPKKKGESH